MLSPEQVTQIKKQLFSQLENANIPNKEEVKASIQTMDAEQLEQFLKQNQGAQQGEQQCIFCSIAEDKVPSYKINENEEAIAILEINPISKGHAIVIPKIHSDKVPPKAIELAQQTGEQLRSLNPKKIDVTPSTMFGHEILNVLPVYKNETLDSPKQKANDQELKQLQGQLLQTKPEEKPKETKKKKSRRKKRMSDKTHWLPKRIP